MVYHKGQALGHCYLNIFLCDLSYFLEATYIANYADDTTPYNAQEFVR